jgi:Na+-transporting NADH:ubiquinone oxidoreductase subunit C
MAAKSESALRVFLVSAAVAVTCSVMVTAAVAFFRPIQYASIEFEMNRDILQAAGLIDRDETVSYRAVSERFEHLEVRLADLDAGTFVAVDDPASYDYMKAASEPASSTVIPGDRDTAKLGRRSKLMPVYLVMKGDLIETIVLPVYGNGMWSVISGYIALSGDFYTIESLVIHEHGETPGIGDRIEAAHWLDNWRGKQVVADGRDVPLKLVTSPTPDADQQAIDAITGATVTSQGVVSLANFWLGQAGYGPLLRTLSQDKIEPAR